MREIYLEEVRGDMIIVVNYGLISLLITERTLEKRVSFKNDGLQIFQCNCGRCDDVTFTIIKNTRELSIHYDGDRNISSTSKGSYIYRRVFGFACFDNKRVLNIERRGLLCGINNNINKRLYKNGKLIRQL